MGRVRAKQRAEKDPGYYFFPDTWLGCEVQLCGHAAKGLWADMLARMWGSDPRGTLPGKPKDFAAAMGHKGEMGKTYWSIVESLIEELEEARVFSRGSEMDGVLDAAAIVNRRMYREYCKAIGRSESARKAAQIRHGKPKVAKSDYDGPAAMPQKADAQVMRVDPFEGESIQGVRQFERCERDAENKADCVRASCHSETNSTDSTLRSDLVSRVDGGLVGKDVFASIVRETGDGEPWKGWWRSVVKCFEAQGQLHLLHELIEYVRSCRDPLVRESKGVNEIRSVARYMVSQAIALSRQQGLALPGTPKGCRSE